MSVQTFGLAAFRAAIQRNLELAEFAESLVRSHDELTLMAPATLGIVCFRREWPGLDEAETERRGIALIDALERTGTALVSSTRLAGRHAIRLCILNPTSSEEHVRRVIEHFAGAPAPPAGRRDGAVPAGSRAGLVADPDGDVLRTMPLLAGVADSTVQAVRARGVHLDTDEGEEVIRRWDSDRSFYIVLSGRYDVLIDGRPIRAAGPGDHFGELAARDWGGGYGYTRLATVRCAQPGRLLQADQRGLSVAGRQRAGRQGQARHDPGRTPPAALARPRLRGPVVVDLVEVADAVEASAAARPLPHQRVLAAAGDPAEEARAGPGGAAGQAPARGRVRQAAGEGLIGPFVGVRSGMRPRRCRRSGPDGWRRVHAALVRGVAGQVGGEPVEVGPVEARRDAVGADHAAARRGVDGVPAVVGGGGVAGRVPRELDVRRRSPDRSRAASRRGPGPAPPAAPPRRWPRWWCRCSGGQRRARP